MGQLACDDGGASGGCSAAGAINANYYCYPGTIGKADSCVESCGNGLNPYPTGSGRCDDGNNMPWDGCDSYCNVESGYTCVDNAATKSTCSEVCGDGIKIS
jgi:cysteine-rich repeat protein